MIKNYPERMIFKISGSDFQFYGLEFRFLSWVKLYQREGKLALKSNSTHLSIILKLATSTYLSSIFLNIV